MIKREPENEGVRAWVLIRAKEPETAAAELYGALGYPPQIQDYPWIKSVMVRVDVVEDYYYNIVIPVDAESPEALQEVVCAIQKQTGATETAVLRVTRHFPEIPHAADGYITGAEFDRFPDPGAMVGRQRTSPGMNPWG